MTVAASHFLPDITPLPFHRRRQDICQKSKELLELVEIEYSKMYRKDVRVVPVLPNLVTSTDETTVFVTSGVIKDYERVHITAKPTSVKMIVLVVEEEITTKLIWLETHIVVGCVLY